MDEHLIHTTDESDLGYRRKVDALTCASTLLQHFVPGPGQKLSKVATDIAGVFEAYLKGTP